MIETYPLGPTLQLRVYARGHAALVDDDGKILLPMTNEEAANLQTALIRYLGDSNVNSDTNCVR